VLLSGAVPSGREERQGEEVPNEVGKGVEEGVQNLVREQVGRVWKALAADSKTVGLRVEQRAAARLVGQVLVAVYEVDNGSFGLFFLFLYLLPNLMIFV
jgi:hypothetical protein